MKCKCITHWYKGLERGHTMECLKKNSPNLVGAQKNFKRSRK